MPDILLEIKTIQLIFAVVDGSTTENQGEEKEAEEER